MTDKTASVSPENTTSALSHLAFCALAALGLARQDGIAGTPYAENLFLIRSLAIAQKQKRLPDKAPIYGRALALLKCEGRCPPDAEHRQIKYRNNVIECDHGKLKRIISATLGFISMKTAYATIKGIEVMWALRKGQAENFNFGHPLGEMHLVSKVFEM